jgi:hypothetical protein
MMQYFNMEHLNLRSARQGLVLGSLLIALGIVESAWTAEVEVANTGAIRPEGSDLLKLENGDQLAGQLLSASPEDGISWRHGHSSKAAKFKFDAVTQIELEPLDRDETPVWSRSLIRLSNGDEMVGRLVEVNETQAVLETWYGGVLTFPRERWQWIVFEDEPEPPLYSGPEGLEDWTVGDVSMARVQSGDWVYHEGAFYATKAASIARNLDLPDRSQIQFDLHWKGTLNLAFALYTDYLHPVSLANKDTEPDFGGFYSLQLNSYFANVLMVKQGVPLQYLGQVQTPAFAKKRKAHIDIRVDKKGDSVALLVDGELVKQWVDKTGFAGEGTGVRMVHQGQGAIRFGDFRVSPWNGQFDEAPTVRASAEEDLVTLRNGDKLIGKIQSVGAETINLALIGGETAMPLRDVKKIEFAGIADLKAAQLGAVKTVKSRFAQQGIIHVEIAEVIDNRLKGSSPNFGAVDLDLRAFKQISFEE